MEDSKQHFALQAVDCCKYWTLASHKQQCAEKVACKRIAMTLGWENLVHDTMPNDEFNFWHFPQEYRNTPSTRKVEIDLNVPSVSREQFERWAELYS